MRSVETDTYNQLSTLKKDTNSYKELLKKLMIQGFIRIDEEVVTVRVVKEDLKLAQSVFEAAISEYKKIWKQGVGVADPITATLDSNTNSLFPYLFIFRDS